MNFHLRNFSIFILYYEWLCAPKMKMTRNDFDPKWPRRRKKLLPTFRTKGKCWWKRNVQISPIATYLYISRLHHFYHLISIKTWFRLRNFVPLHQQSKEQPIVPKGGHNRRPQLGLNDGRRRSSIKTQNRGKTRAFRVVVIQRTLKHRTEYD